MKLYSVTNGTKKDLETVNDEAFAQGMLGEGIAILSSDGCIYAPIDCQVTMLFPTHHAIGLKTENGMEVLIHIGIDTVEMNGDGFQAFVKQSDEVKQGDLLIQYDVGKVLSAGYEPDVMVIITNLLNTQILEKTKLETLTLHDVLLEIK